MKVLPDQYQKGKDFAKTGLKESIEKFIMQDETHLSAIATFHNDPNFVAGCMAQLFGKELVFKERILSETMPSVAINVYEIDGLEKPFIISYLPHFGNAFDKAIVDLGNKNTQIRHIRNFWLERGLIKTHCPINFYDDSHTNFLATRGLDFKINSHQVAGQSERFLISQSRTNYQEEEVLDASASFDADANAGHVASTIKQFELMAAHGGVAAAEAASSSASSSVAAEQSNEERRAAAIKDQFKKVAGCSADGAAIAEEGLKQCLAAFESQLKLIKSKSENLRKRNQLTACWVAEDLHSELSGNLIKFNNSEINLDQFISGSKQSIDKAHVALDKHRGWTEILGNLSLLLLGLVGFLIKGAVNLCSNRPFLFFARTDSQRILDETEACLDQLTAMHLYKKSSLFFILIYGKVLFLLKKLSQ